MRPLPMRQPAAGDGRLACMQHLHFPNEGAAYRQARNQLLAEEMELRRHIERVAAHRRALPQGGEVPEDYVFEGEAGPIRLSQLFAPDKDTLAIYSFMFGPERDRPCPGCTHLSGLHPLSRWV